MSSEETNKTRSDTDEPEFSDSLQLSDMDLSDIKRNSIELFSAPYIPPVKREEKPEEPERKNSDFLVDIIRAASIIAWMLSVLCLLFLVKARPSDGLNFYMRYYGMAATPTGWDAKWLKTSFVLMVVTAALSTLGIVLNLIRLRKAGRVRKSLIVLFVVNIISIAAFLAGFGLPF